MENDNRQAGDALTRAIDKGSELLRLSGADFSHPDYVSSVEAVFSELTKCERRCAQPDKGREIENGARPWVRVSY